MLIRTTSISLLTLGKNQPYLIIQPLIPNKIEKEGKGEDASFL